MTTTEPRRFDPGAAGGFTLVELLAAMALSLIVFSALLTLVVSTTRATARVSDRVDATQRGRTAMARMTQELRAMVCLPVTGGAVRPVLEGTDTQVVWYANLDRDATVDDDDRNGIPDPVPPAAPIGDADPAFDPDQRRLSFDEANGRIVEERWSGPLPVAAGAAPTATSTVITDVRQTGDTAVFRYYGYADSSATEPTELTTPLSAVDRERVARIDVTYTADATSKGFDPRTSAFMEGTVFPRTMTRPAPPATDVPIFSCAV